MTRLKRFCKILCKPIILAVIGGAVYYGVEMLWRGYSYWSMAVTGGICFILIGLINHRYEWEMRFTSQMIAGLIITAVELIACIILNIWLRLDIWNYSGVPYNFMGQICLSYMMLWQ